MKTLYKRTVKGAIQQWSVEVIGNRFKTIEGQLNGKLTTSKWTECYGKNTGRANGTTPNEQALAQAQSKWQKKVDSGYQLSVDDIDSCTLIKPMLAHKLKDFEDTLSYPLYTQPKLDGIRCIVSHRGMFSRNGKEILSAPHIFESLKPFLDKNSSLIFDGELYNHELKEDFNKIISLTRKSKPSQEDLEESKKMVQYHVYDMICGDIFSKRMFFLSGYLDNVQHVRLVKTRAVRNRQELDNYYAQFLEEGYEGQMLRTDTPYENKRSKCLLKRKEFMDEEFTILDIEEGQGNRSGMMGRIHFKTSNGRSFTASARGGESLYIDMLENKQSYIGKRATVRYQNMTPDGSPRFPVVVAIRDYE